MSLSAYQELEFDLASALRDRLIALFDAMSSAPLDRDGIERDVPNQQGVYQIFKGQELVYLGKTDSEAGLKARLTRHADKVQHRRNLDPAEITYKAIRLYVFTVMDLETALLKAAKPAWNGRGFGSNDPGRERDTTRIKPVNFDSLYPIAIDRPFVHGGIPAAELPADQAIAEVMRHVPWRLRYQGASKGSRAPHPELSGTTVHLPANCATPWNVLTAIVRQLPLGWQLTALKSHVILYKEHKEYPEPQAVEFSTRTGG